MAVVALIVVGLIALFIVKRFLGWFFSKNRRHQVVDLTEDVALASKVAAVIGGISLYFLAPAGIFALFVSPPLIVVIAPAIAAFATLAFGIHALARLIDKARAKRHSKPNKWSRYVPGLTGLHLNGFRRNAPPNQPLNIGVSCTKEHQLPESKGQALSP